MSALAWLLATMQAAAALPFLVEVLAGLLPRRSPRFVAGPAPRTAVLMPAHDEARQIGAVLEALAPVLPPRASVLVVADNCGDDTAAVARAAGVTVIERHDPARRGKGYALAFGRDHLRGDPPEVVIVLDADCRAAPGALARLAGAAAHGRAPAQGLYLLRHRADAAAAVKVSTFAFLVKNWVRQRGLRRLGAPAGLGGTGMAFPWAIFADAPLASGDLVEDLALGIDLALAGHPARFEEAAAIWSAAAAADATVGQRARWEGGMLQAIRTRAPGLIAAGLRRGRPSLVWMGLHVATPPLTVLILGEGAATLLVALLGIGGRGAGPLALSLAVLAALGGAVLGAWLRFGRSTLPAATLLRLPLYLAWKLPLTLRLVRGRGPAGWVRTERDG